MSSSSNFLSETELSYWGMPPPPHPPTTLTEFSIILKMIRFEKIVSKNLELRKTQNLVDFITKIIGWTNKLYELGVQLR